MKPSDFYEGNTPVHGIITTDEITDIADPSVDFMDAYYMGYVSFFNLPENIKFHNVNQVGGSLQIINQSDRNHAWGFCKSARVTGGSSYSDVLVPHNGTLFNKRSGTVEPRFYNSIEMARFANANWLFITLRYIFIPSSDLDSNNSAYNNRQSNGSYTMQTATCYLPVIGANIGGVDYSGFNDFMNGNSQLNFGTATLNGDSVSLTFNFDDFGDDSNPTCKREVTAGGSSFTLFAQITSFGFYDRGKYLYEDSSYDEPCVPFIEFDNLIENQGVKTMSVGTSSEFTQMYINLDSRTGNYILSSGIGFNYIVSNWYQGNFYIENDEMDGGSTGSEYWYASLSRYNYPGFSRDGIIRGRHITDYRSTSENNFFIYTFMRPIDIWLSIIMYHKIDTLHKDDNTVVPINTYTEDYSVSIYMENVPSDERVQEEFSSIEPKLMNWQKPNIDIIEDDFDIDDMPIDPVPPPTPPEDDERTSGSWRANSDLVNFGNANGFVTQYVITGNQLQSLGHYLWSGFWDDDFIDSIMVSFIENFSLYPADILKYFVSIRKYPLDLNGAAYNLGWSSQIYIGRGKKGINLDTGTNTIGVLPNFAHCIRTEWKKIPANYHDFRDYEPCCRVVIFVPFCGEVELTPSQAIDSEVRLEYCIDFSNGAVECAVVIRPAEKPNDLYIAAVLTGSMGANVQLSASNLTQCLISMNKAVTGQVQSLIQDVGTAVTLAAGAMEAGEGTSTDKGKYLGGLTSTVGGHVGDSLDSLTGLVGTPVPKFGNNNGFSSFLVLTPNIQITYRWYEQPSNYGHAVGYACNKAVKIKDLEGKGFSVFRNVDLSGIPATQDELAAIEALLQSGVYL